MPPETALVPPTVSAFSYTATLAPRTAAVSAAVRPAAPLPSTTTSTAESHCPTESHCSGTARSLPPHRPGPAERQNHLRDFHCPIERMRLSETGCRNGTTTIAGNAAPRPDPAPRRATEPPARFSLSNRQNVIL